MCGRARPKSYINSGLARGSGSQRRAKPVVSVRVRRNVIAILALAVIGACSVAIHYLERENQQKSPCSRVRPDSVSLRGVLDAAIPEGAGSPQEIVSSKTPRNDGSRSRPQQKKSAGGSGTRVCETTRHCDTKTSVKMRRMIVSDGTIRFKKEV